MGEEPLFPSQNPLGRLTPIKDGMMILGAQKGNLIGQALKDKDVVRVTLADGGAIDVYRKNGEFVIKPALLNGAQRDAKCPYVFFGNEKTYQYSLFRKEPGVVKPFLAARVVEHPFKDKMICVEVSDDENPFRIVLICAAIGLLS